MLIPFEYLDKVCLSGTRAPSSCFAPTWRLYLRGALTEQVLRRALDWLVRRYPYLDARVVGAGGEPLDRARRLHWRLPGGADGSALLTTLDLRGRSEDERELAEQRVVDRFLDLEREPPMAVTWLATGQDASAVFLKQHHALADGRAFFALVSDLVAYLDLAQRALEPELAPVPRRRERDALVAQRLGHAGAFVRGLLHTFAEGVRQLLMPSAPLHCNLGRDFSGRDRTVHLTMPVARIDGLKTARARHQLSTNDLLTGALASALSRWSQACGTAPGRTRLLVPVDVRPPRQVFESFANHLSSYQVTLLLGDLPPPLALAKEVSRQIAAQRARAVPQTKLLVEAFVVSRLRLGTMRRFVLDAPRLLANYSFSNLISLGGSETWRGQGFEVERLRVTTPCLPPQGINTTVLRYGDEVCFNFNYKDSAVRRADVEALAGEFSRTLDELERALA